MGNPGNKAQRKTSGAGLDRIQTFRERRRTISDVTWSPDGRTLASASENSICLWDLASGELVRMLEGHRAAVVSLAWSRDGLILASGSADCTVRTWDAAGGKRLRILEGHRRRVVALEYSPDGRALASGSDDGTARLWKPATGESIRSLEGHERRVLRLAWSPDGRILASGSSDRTIRLWNSSDGTLKKSVRGQGDEIGGMCWSPDGRALASAADDYSINLWNADGALLDVLSGHGGQVSSLAWSPDGTTLASGSKDSTVCLWQPSNRRLMRALEGHTGPVNEVCFAADGQVLVSKSFDGTVRLWNVETGQALTSLLEPSWKSHPSRMTAHPTRPILVTLAEVDTVIDVWQLDLGKLRSTRTSTPSSEYINAKIVLVGDTGVGKTGLAHVLTNRTFVATESTHGRHVWTFESSEIALGGNRREIRDALLWDLAGQPSYRLIHQLHLNDVAVAVVVFDARSETDPLAGVQHWFRALRLAEQRHGRTVPVAKLLVAARADRGGVSVSKARLEALAEEFGFRAHFETSSKEGWQIEALKQAIHDAIPWSDLPVVTSSVLFASIKRFLLAVKESGRLLVAQNDLYDELVRQQPALEDREEDLRAQFDTCIGRLETRDLIRRLSFGGYLLLQPELLDNYASAMINAAKNEPDGLGSIAEDDALSGRFYIPDDGQPQDRGRRQLLLHATVEELLRHDLALRENAEGSRYLVFPSQFNRDYEDAPEPTGKTLVVGFDGPVQSLYATLVVRLSHSGLFATDRTEMWRNAVIYSARVGGKCGIYLREIGEARGELALFFDAQASNETRFHFEQYVGSHLERRAIADSIRIVRSFVCPACDTAVPDTYVQMLRSRGAETFHCPCGGSVLIADPTEKLAQRFPSRVETMERAADRERDLDAFVFSAGAETQTQTFLTWAGGEKVTLAIVFTDIVESTALGQDLGDERMNELRQAHFRQGRRLLEHSGGREVKTIGDSFMVAFHSAVDALDFAMALHADAGHEQIQIRAGIHIGPLRVERGDTFGGTVNFAARVVAAIEGAQIWLSERAREDVDLLGSKHHCALRWEHREGIELKGFRGKFTLWQLAMPPRQEPTPAAPADA